MNYFFVASVVRYLWMQLITTRWKFIALQIAVMCKVVDKVEMRTVPKFLAQCLNGWSRYDQNQWKCW